MAAEEVLESIELGLGRARGAELVKLRGENAGVGGGASGAKGKGGELGGGRGCEVAFELLGKKHEE